MARIGDFWTVRQRVLALEDVWRKLESAPQDPRIRLKAGDLLQRIGRIDAAVEQYREAFHLFSRKGFERQARAARAMILRLRPDDPAVLRSLEFPTDLDLARTQAPLPREVRGSVRNDEDERSVSPSPSPSPSGSAPGLPPRQALPALPARVEDDLRATVIPIRGREAADGGEIELGPPIGVVMEDPSTGGGVVVSVDASEPGLRSRPRDRRGDPRIEADGVVHLSNGTIQGTGILEDVSATGLFVSGPRTFAPGEILDLAIRLPGADWTGAARARVMRSVEANRRRPAGLGLGLLWADAPTERWVEEFVVAAFGEAPAAPPAVEPSGGIRDDVRRAFPRSEVEVPTVLESEEFEASGWMRDVSEGGAFVEAPRVFGPGRRIKATLWLPEPASDGATLVSAGVTPGWTLKPMRVEAVVAHDVRPSSIGRPHRGGMGIRFVRLDDEARRRIAALVARAAAL